MPHYGEGIEDKSSRSVLHNDGSKDQAVQSSGYPWNRFHSKAAEWNNIVRFGTAHPEHCKHCASQQKNKKGHDQFNGQKSLTGEGSTRLTYPAGWKDYKKSWQRNMFPWQNGQIQDIYHFHLLTCGRIFMQFLHTGKVLIPGPVMLRRSCFYK